MTNHDKDEKGDKALKASSSNDQIVRTVPGTDVGGHDTAGVDGEKRTERAGEILGTVNPDGSDVDRATANREHEMEKADFITKEVDRANREDLPRLGGDAPADGWEPIEGGPPSSLPDGTKIIGPKAKDSDKL